MSMNTGEALQVFTIENVRKYIADGNTLYSSVCVYRGFIGPDSSNAVLQMQMKPIAGKRGKDFTKQIDWFKENLFGEYTVVLKPSNEIFYVANGEGDDSSDIPQGIKMFPATVPMNGGGGVPATMQDVVKEIVELRLENVKLKAENKSLVERIAMLNSTEYKLSSVIGTVYGQLTGNKALQANNNNSINSTMAQEEMIAVTDDMSALQKAWAKLHNMFGEQELIRIADRLEREPDKVQLVKSFL